MLYKICLFQILVYLLFIPIARRVLEDFLESYSYFAALFFLLFFIIGDTAYFCVQHGYEKSDDNNRRAVLEQMANEPNRRAKMVSTLVAVRSEFDPEPLIAVGRVEGEITREAIGTGGFGFDPVMFIPALGKTMAQLDPAHKNHISHRGQSARQMVELLRAHWLI